MFHRIALLSLVVFGSAPSSHAAVFCVSNEQQADAALFTARVNDQADDVRFVAVPGGMIFADGLTIADDDSYGVRVTGGWNDTCTTRTPGVRTRIEMATNDSLRFFDLVGSVSLDRPGLQYEFAGFDLIGASNQTGAAALRVTAAFGFDGRILIEDVVFDQNRSGTFGVTAGAVEITSFASNAGVVVLRNARFWRNEVFDTNPIDLVAAALRIRTVQGPVYVSNCTFYGNTTTAVNGIAGVLVDPTSGGPVHLVNNVFGGHLSSDLRVTGQTRVNFNYYANLVGTPNGASGGNIIGVDPRLVDPINGNLRLRADSPVLGQGTATPIGGLAARDLDGRLRGAVLDFGAYDRTAANLVFRDGFEGGN